MHQQPKPFSIKCQCSAYRNGLLITSKKKSKLSNLILDPKTRTIHIIPLNSKDENYIFELKRLKHIHKKFLTEGKITIEFTEEAEKGRETLSITEGKNVVERLAQIFVEAASPENLQLLIKKIVQLKSVMKADSKSQTKKQQIEKEHITEDEAKNATTKHTSILNKKKQDFPKLQKFQESLTERKKDPLKYNHTVKKYQEEEKNRNSKVSRRELMKQAYSGEPLEVEQQKLPEVRQIFRPSIDFLTIPNQLLKKIFEYTKLELRYRVISKNFDRFVLKNLKGLNFRDEVDDETFNKLAKYVANIRGRLKNVRTIELIDVYNEPQLQKNQAKSLYFGEWKQMSRKNILQIKGLRIHTLQMPYLIKFQFQHIYGIRLKQLHLTSKSQITTANSMILDQNLIYLLKHVNQLEALSIPYINSSVLDELTTNLKQKTAKMRWLKLGSVNENCKREEKWFLFHGYEELRVLTVERVLRGGTIVRNCSYALTFPNYLQELEIGSFVSKNTINGLPTTLTYLKLMGEQYYNSDISHIFLPYLKCFDISECPMVRPSVINELQKCNKLKMITNWDKQDFEYWKEMAKEKEIEVISVKGMIVRR